MALLFSYGTLQQGDVQLSTFGRALQGRPDVLVGFELSTVTIQEPAFVAASGTSEHAIVTFTGNDRDRVSGMVFEITDTELARADAYEPAGYERALAMLASGTEAWVYARTAAAA
jgi:gamma-glutamylcyclotransferase (GGCT)/AIG2-like uncharacterized protein YtfP